MKQKKNKTTTGRFYLKFILKKTIPVLLFIAAVLISTQIKAQEPKLAQITPKSPNMAAFEKFTEVPVGLGTGVVNLQVPIYEIQVGQLKIPITLNHHNNGLKTDEVPSWVGHGWSLSTGGYISYQQNGKNDFDPQFGLFPSGLSMLNQFYGNQMTNEQKRFYYEDIIAGNIDAEHDEYSYNFLGNTGTFHFLNPTTSRTNPKVDLKVSKTPSGFKIIDDRGNIFFFEAAESITMEDPTNIDGRFVDNSAYYVSRILTADNKEVLFTYKTYFCQYTTSTSSLSFTETTCQSAFAGPSYQQTLTKINYMLPDEIIFPSGKVKFNHSNAVRADLLQINASSTARSLNGITVYDKNNQKQREFSFDMSYFGTNTRLKLNSVAEVNNNQIIKKWNFDYYEGMGMASIFSKSKDHWGYFNGKSSSNNFPEADYQSLIGVLYNNAITPNANRTSDFEFAKAGMLKSVQYPTGGKTEFEYEQNQFVTDSINVQLLQPFLRPPSQTFTVPIADAHAYNGATLTGSFTIPKSDYYELWGYKNLSSDYMYMDSEMFFRYPNGQFVNFLMDPINQSCNSTERSCGFIGIIFIPAGTYNYEARGSSYPINGGQGTFWLHAGFSIRARDNGAYPIGGGRIAKVTSFESEGKPVLTKIYKYSDSLKKVSFKGNPNYMSQQEIGVAGNGGSGLFCLYCNMVKVWEQSVAPMVGPVIEYGRVIELSDSLGNFGKTERFFSFSENRGGSYAPPVVVPKNTSWSGGLMLKENVFEKNLTIPKQENIISYASEYLSSQINGLKVGYQRYCTINSVQTRSYILNPTTVYSEDFKRTASRSKSNEGTLSIQTMDTLTYFPLKHHSPISATQTASNGKDIVKKTRYVFDYDNLPVSSDDPSRGLMRLMGANMNYPIEELSIKKIDGADYVIAGVLRTFKAGQTVLDEIYSLVLKQPVLLSGFNLSSVNASGLFTKDLRYVLKVKFDSYHPTNFNLLQQHTVNGPNICYLYSYNNQFPIAEISNIDYGTLETVLGGQSAIELFSSGNPTDAEVRSFLSVLRTSPYLKDSQVTSYTFRPLTGMTSMTDTKGMTTFYEYDVSGRLKMEKDHLGKVIKMYDYNYRQP